MATGSTDTANKAPLQAAANGVLAVPSYEDPEWMRVEELACCSVPFALRAAIQLNVFNIISRHGSGRNRLPGVDPACEGLSAAQIVAHLDPPAPLPAAAAATLERVLRLLASYSLLTASSSSSSQTPQTLLYGLTPSSSLLLQSNPELRNIGLLALDRSQAPFNPPDESPAAPDKFEAPSESTQEDGACFIQASSGCAPRHGAFPALDKFQAPSQGLDTSHAPSNRSQGVHCVAQGASGPPPRAASLAPLALLISHPACVASWLHLPQSILHGQDPFSLANHGMDIFSYCQHDALFGSLFHSSMAHSSTLITQSLLQVYHGFHGLASLVDVGGGLGSCLHMIVSKYPSIKGINFDLPHVIKAAPTYSGVQHVEGDMFERIPQADAMIIKRVLQNWSDEKCIQILKNCYDALPSDGKVMVVDTVLPSELGTDAVSRLGYQIDLRMLVFCPGGRERTEQEIKALAEAAGFARAQVVCRVHKVSVVEILKS